MTGVGRELKFSTGQRVRVVRGLGRGKNGVVVRQSGGMVAIQVDGGGGETIWTYPRNLVAMQAAGESSIDDLERRLRETSIGDAAGQVIREPLIGERITHHRPVLVQMGGFDEEWELIVTTGKKPPYGYIDAGRILITIQPTLDDVEPLAGLLWIREHDKKVITHVWVDPTAQRRGVGHILISSYREYVSKVVRMTGPFSDAGQSFAKRIGAKVVAEATAPDTDWEDYLVAGDAQYVPPVVLPQMPDVVARALAAGAQPPLEYVGAGMTGVVFCTADGLAYKVSRTTASIAHQTFEDEAEWLASAAHVPDVAPLVAQFHRFDPTNLVIVRDCPRADPDTSTWRYGEGRLFDLHRSIEQRMVPNGWTAPEFKPDSYVITERGPVLVDASMPSRVGAELARFVESVVAGDRPLRSDSPRDLAFAVRMERDRTLSPAEVDRLQALIEHRWPGATT